MSTLLLSILGAFAKFERSLIKERQMEGIFLAKKRGGKAVLSLEQVETIKTRVAQGHKKSHIASNYNISRKTLYQYLKK